MTFWRKLIIVLIITIIGGVAFLALQIAASIKIPESQISDWARLIFMCSISISLMLAIPENKGEEK